MLGSSIGAFTPKYQQPNDHSTPSTGSHHFQRYSGSNTDSLIVQTDITDGDAYKDKVQDISAQAPDGGWTDTQASATCAPFLPPDAVYKRQVTLANGYDKIYSSDLLAKQFPVSAFTDSNQNQIQAGLFDINYLVTGTTIDGCELVIGTQQAK